MSEKHSHSSTGAPVPSPSEVFGAGRKSQAPQAPNASPEVPHEADAIEAQPQVAPEALQVAIAALEHLGLGNPSRAARSPRGTKQGEKTPPEKSEAWKFLFGGNDHRRTSEYQESLPPTEGTYGGTLERWDSTHRVVKPQVGFPFVPTKVLNGDGRGVSTLHVPKSLSDTAEHPPLDQVNPDNRISLTRLNPATGKEEQIVTGNKYAEAVELISRINILRTLYGESIADSNKVEDFLYRHRKEYSRSETRLMRKATKEVIHAQGILRGWGVEIPE